MMKPLHTKMNRVYSFIESDLSSTQKKFLNFHQHHVYIKHLKVDFIPQEHERTILIIADNFGKIHKETIDHIPFDYILIIDPFFDKYTCSIIDGKKVFQIPLEPVIFLQIVQGEKLKIDSLFLSKKNDSLFDFLLEMCYPLMKEKNGFVIISDASSSENQSSPTQFENKIKTLPFEIVHKIEQKDFKQFDMFMFMIKTNETETYKINGKLVTVSHMSFWNHIDTLLEVHFTTFSDEWVYLLINLYEDDIFNLDGVYVSEDQKVYNLTKMEDLNELIKKCEFRVIGITLNPRIYEQIFQILMSENSVQEVYIYGFFDEGNTI